MAITTVTPDDLRPSHDALVAAGIPQDEIVARLRTIAKEMEYQNTKDQGPSVGIKAALTGVATMPADIMTGLSTLTGAGSEAESMLKNVSTFLRDKFVNPDWQRTVGEEASGPLTSMKTWEANLGSMVPMIAELALLRKAGTSMGGMVSPLASKIAGIAAPTAGFGLQSAGSFYDTAKSQGISDAVAKPLAASVGVLNAGMGELGFLAGVGGMAADTAKVGMVKKALTELGVTALGGLGMAGTDEVNYHALQMAQDRMMEQDPTWTPAQPSTPDNPLRAFVLGAGPIGVMRGAAHVVSQITPGALKDRIYQHTMDLSNEGKLSSPDFETGMLARPTESINLEPTGFASQMQIAKTQPTTEQLRGAVERATDSRIALIASNLKIEVPEGTDPASLRSLVMGKIGQVQEGPQLSLDGAIKSNVINMATPMETEWGRRVEDSARAYFKQGPEPADLNRMTHEHLLATNTIDPVTGQPLFDPTNPEVFQAAQKNVLDATLEQNKQKFIGMRTQALLDAGLTPELAQHPTLNPPDINKGNRSLPSYLTRDQYAKYSDSLKGQLESTFRADIGNEFARDVKNNQFKAELFTNLQPDPIIDSKTGKEVGGIHMEDANYTMMSASVFMPHPIQQVMFDAATGARSLEPVRVLGRRLAQFQDTEAKIGKYRLNAWIEDIPRQFNAGTGRARMHDLVAYLRVRGGDATEVKNLVDQLGLKDTENPEHILAQRVIDGSKINSTELLPRLLRATDPKQFKPEDIVGMATKIAAKERVLSDWYVRNGFIDPEMYRDHYMPWIKKYWGVKDASMEGWEKYRDTVMHQGLRDAGFSEQRIAEMKSIHDMTGKFAQRGIQIPTTDPFFQYLRKADEESLGMIARETDQDVLSTMYTRQALKHFYFDDITPGLAGYMKNIEGQLLMAQEKNQRLGTKLNVPYDGTMQMLQDMMDGYLGITPDRATKSWNKYNLVSNSNMVTRMIKAGAEGWNKHLGFKHEIPDVVSTSDALSGLMSLMHVRYLGLPFNWKSPIKNIMTQLPAAQLFGEGPMLRGMVKAIHGEERVYFDKLGVLNKDFLPIHGQAAFMPAMRSIGELSLHQFKSSENLLRMTSAHAALECWNRLEPILKNDPKLDSMTLDNFSKTLLRGQKLADFGAPESALMKNMPLAERYQENFKKWDITERNAPRGFKGITDMMYELIRQGKSSEAKDFFVQLGAELPNWRYGKGGGISAFRNPVVKAMTMFMRWPMNYAAFHGWLANPNNGLIRREFMIHASTFALAGLALQLGLSQNTARWIGLGPLPEQVGFGGPLYDEFSKVWKALISGTEAGLSTTLATPEQRDKSFARYHQNWKAAFGGE